jgi:S1-C subfamily serine protease
MYDGVAYPATLVKLDKDVDLALVQVPELKYVSFFTFGTTPKVGEQVMSFGSPVGFQGITTVGWVASKPRMLDMIIMFHTAFINPGNSGGPLVNLRGEMVGVNRGIIKTDPFTLAQGLFFAVPVGVIKEFLKDE